MNGRAYDYNLGRFLSVDPFIQEPGNSQSMNPYSYIMNNPLAGTDPTGYTSVGNLGVTDEFCASYKCAVVDKVLAGFTMAGENGASLSQKRDAAKEAKNRSIIGKIESQGGTADVRYWNGGKVKLSELSYVHTAVSAGTDLLRRSDRHRFASNNSDDVANYLSQQTSNAIEFDVVERINKNDDIPLPSEISENDAKLLAIKRVTADMRRRSSRNLSQYSPDGYDAQQTDVGLMVVFGEYDEGLTYSGFDTIIISRIAVLSRTGTLDLRDVYAGNISNIDSIQRKITVIYGHIGGDWHKRFKEGYANNRTELIQEQISKARRMGASSVIRIDKNYNYSEFYSNGNYDLYQ